MVPLRFRVDRRDGRPCHEPAPLPLDGSHPRFLSSIACRCLVSPRLKTLVPKGGLEPPHPCEYMDLNHARLPIPPLRHGVIRPAQLAGARLTASFSLSNTAAAVKPGAGIES